jgi:hypothetical protein
MKKLFVAMIIMGTLTYCIPTSKGPSIFEDQVCGKLCWNNIVVGNTEKQELFEIISTIPNVDQDSIISYDNPDGELFDGEISFQYYRALGNPNSLVDIAARTQNQKIILLIFQGNLGLTFQDVVDVFGEPDFVSSLWAFDGGINVHFINSSKGIEIDSYFKSEKFSVTPDTEVNYLIFFDTDLYQIFLESDFLTGDYEGFVLYPWNGYGRIEDNYWPPTKH